jgi:hypothetical protein
MIEVNQIILERAASSENKKPKTGAALLAVFMGYFPR